MRYLVPILIVTAVLVAIDAYVYWNWRRFVHEGEDRLKWTLPIYRVTMVVMPFALPVYLNLFRWWEVEPRLARALFFGFWAIYYVPKVPIVAVLLVKDLMRAGGWLMRARDGRSDTRVRSNEQTPRPTGGAPLSRGEFLRRVGWSAAAVPFIVTGYSVFRTLYDFNVRHVDVPIAGLPRALDGVTIAQISDLHAGSLFSERPMREAVALVNDLRPDAVAVTGDFVNSSAGETPVILPALSTLSADLGVFGCLGNHDHYAETGRLVSQLGSTPLDLLVNTHRTFHIDGARLHIIGTDNTGFNQNYADLPRAVEGIEAEDDASVRILLAHDPTFWDTHVRRSHPEIDLMLCGHTHGGQFGIEIGPLRWGLAKLRYDRWAGLYSEPRTDAEGTQWLYVNRGIGTVGPPLRLGIPPEITLLTLRRV